MRKTLQQIRSDLKLLIDQQDSTSPDYSDSELNGLINQGVQYMASLVEYPRDIAEIQVEDNVSSYTLLSDTMKLLVTYFGNRASSGDVAPLEIVTQEKLKELSPSWLETTSDSKNRPKWACLIDRNTILLHPRPDTENSVSGKKLYVSYVYYPDSLSADGDYPDLPPIYHQFVAQYAAHLCYLGKLKNADMARTMLDETIKKVKSVQPQVVNETSDLYFDFGNDDYDYGGDGDLAHNRL